MVYLTSAEYVKRFGARETTLLTFDGVPVPNVAPTYDTLKLEAQISDATDQVEGYISRRYAVPLASAPSIVKGWVGALTRFNLAVASGHLSDAIKIAYDSAIRQLEQLAADKLDLPIPEGGTALPENSGGSPMSSGDRAAPTFTSQTMSGYTDTFTGSAGYAPCWRQGR